MSLCFARGIVNSTMPAHYTSLTSWSICVCLTNARMKSTFTLSASVLRHWGICTAWIVCKWHWLKGSSSQSAAQASQISASRGIRCFACVPHGQLARVVAKRIPSLASSENGVNERSKKHLQYGTMVRILAWVSCRRISKRLTAINVANKLVVPVGVAWSISVFV